MVFPEPHKPQQQTVSATGLTAAEVRERHAAGQGNTVQRRTGRSTSEIIKANVFTRINAMLGVLLVLVLSTGSFINAAFGLLIIANSAIGIIQELRAKRTLDRLSILNEAPVTVLRDGKLQEVGQEQVVLGDLIQVGAGDQIVVDGQVVQATGLAVDESLLTGEADLIAKPVGAQLLSGSFVGAGSGLFQATAVGEESYSAKLIAEAGAFQLTGSDIQRGINSILKIITWVLIPVGLLTIWQQFTGDEATSVKAAILAMVAALVPMIPEGLVLMTTIAFAVGVVRLGRHGALVNELPAIEGLARVDVVCADKTGTLTENAMQLDRIAAVAQVEQAKVEEVLRALIAAEPRPNDTLQAIAAGVPEGPTPEILAYQGFDSRVKYTEITLPTGTFRLGAPDVLWPADTAAAELMAQGLRVLSLIQLEPEQALQARIVLTQTVRADAKATLEFFEHEQVAVKIISGDNPAAVGNVAERVGVTGEIIDARTSAVTDTIERGTVFGRVTPAQKREMVQTLSQNGHHVAMTGDGVNDVLALKAADIGVAMGAGAPAARAVAQVVLLDNKFATLPRVVAEGRRVIGNIERVAQLFLTKTIYSAVLALLIGLSGLDFPFVPIHVTMIGWFTIGIPGFFLSLAPNTERAQPGFTRRVIIKAIPGGVIIGVLVVAAWVLQLKVWHLDPPVAATGTVIALLMMALTVLAVAAKPDVWWKWLLVLGCIAAYVVIFSVPPLAHTLLLQPAPQSAYGLAVGAVGVVLLLAWLLLGAPRLGRRLAAAS